MVRLCLLGSAGALMAIGCFGCAGQNVEGAWLGPFPFEDAKACRIKIYSEHRFDVACGNLDWAGAGHVERVSDKLIFHFDALVRRGEPQRRLPTVELKFVGEGNTMRLAERGGTEFPLVWHRAAP